MLLPDAPGLPDFPVRGGALPISIERGAFRRATFGDIPFLRDLYRSHRSDEFASLAWPVEQRDAFLDQQFDLQHRSYVTNFPDADFLVILWEGAPVGRIYIDCHRDSWHLVEISLKSERRNSGIGTTIMQAIQHRVEDNRALGVALHVACENEGARRFYRRLGFEEIAQESAHIRMGWTPARPRVN